VVYATGLLVSCTLLLTVEEAYHRSLRTQAGQRERTVSVQVQATATVAAAAAAEPATFSFVPPPRSASLPSSIRRPVAQAAAAHAWDAWGEQGRRMNGVLRERVGGSEEESDEHELERAGVSGAAPDFSIPSLAYASPNPMWWWKAPKLFGGQPRRHQVSGLGPLGRRERDGGVEGSSTDSGSNGVSVSGRTSGHTAVRPGYSSSSLGVVVESPSPLKPAHHPPRSTGLDGELDDTT
jgi:hypothetical protein